MKRTTKKTSRKAQLRVVQRDDHSALLAHFAQCPELFAPMLSLIESGKQSIAAVMNQAGRALVELLLQLSASSIAGIVFTSNSSMIRGFVKARYASTEPGIFGATRARMLTQ